jgi:signal transduction histidine kinase
MMNRHNAGEPVILVVDDVPMNINVLFDALELSGYKVLVANNGESALERAQFSVPDLVLLDIMMPGLNGFETLERMKQIPELKEIPVIFMTALTETVEKVKGFQLGAVDYITKPFQVEEVLMRVKAHLTIKKQKEELRRLNDQLESINASKDKLFSIISHDLRNVFMYVPQMAKIIKEQHMEMDREEIGNIADQCYQDSRTTQSLFENLLHWSRLQRNLVAYEPKEILLQELCKKSCALFESRAASKKINLFCNISDSIRVVVDENMLYTVLRNLLSNAVKFTPENGTVTVGSNAAGNGMIEVFVSDTGVGIKKEDLEKLFRTDVHITKPGTGNEKGTGLGLILCKEFVEKNKGSISVESKENEGTRFTFSLPSADGGG